MTSALFDPGPRARTTSLRWSTYRNWGRHHGNDVRSTDEGVFRELDHEFAFELDVCALPENAKCKWFFTPEQDGLAASWAPARCWMNPPYSELPLWSRKAALEATRGALVVGLLPARTDVGWFHDHVLASGAEVRFVRGRLKFGRARGTMPFPSVVVVWRCPNPSEGRQ